MSSDAPTSLLYKYYKIAVAMKYAFGLELNHLHVEKRNN